MKIAKPFVLNKDLKIEDQLRSLNFFLDKLAKFTQGRVRFGTATDGYRGENIEGIYQTYTSNASANTEDTIAHELAVIPTGFLVMNIDKGGVIYDSGTTWTSTNIYLKCSTTSTTVTLFILK